MKKSIHATRLMAALMIIALCLSMAAPAWAQTVDEWNRSCRVKTKGTTAVFSLRDNGCTGIPVDSLPTFLPSPHSQVPSYPGTA